MTLVKIRNAPFLLIEEDSTKNILPLLRDIIEATSEKVLLFCYEQPVSLWRSIFKSKPNLKYYEEFETTQFNEYTNSKCTIVIDSAQQMVLTLGWNETLKTILKLKKHCNVNQLVLVAHNDCITPQELLSHLRHISSAKVSFDEKEFDKVYIQVKKSGKLHKTEETITYDQQTETLKSFLISKNAKKTEEPAKPAPSQLSTFKIEVEQNDQIEKVKLQLPYMNKIKEGRSKVFYEPDAVDDWDDEDPDDDLSI